MTWGERVEALAWHRVRLAPILEALAMLPAALGVPRG